MRYLLEVIEQNAFVVFDIWHYLDFFFRKSNNHYFKWQKRKIWQNYTMKVPDIEQIIDKVKNVKNSALSALINLQSHPTIDIDGAKFFMKPHLLIQKIHSDTQFKIVSSIY